ncbi:hypothetical protein RIF29_39727 [Crotalaria pallida]|uniref:Uncharacterized protein n=1 Tax=Crotalaria pallida TaxID=3830 RepID=A0AAN9E4T2_CROPI
MAPTCWLQFGSNTVEEWLIQNQTANKGNQSMLHWSVTFGATLESLWMQRNSFVFENVPADVTGCIRQVQYKFIVAGTVPAQIGGGGFVFGDGGFVFGGGDSILFGKTAR